VTTAFAQIAADIAAALSAATPISNQVYRARKHPVAEQHDDALVVRLIGTQVTEMTLAWGRMLCQTLVAVECYAKGPNTSPPDTTVDALLQAAYARIAGDATVNADTRTVTLEAIDWDFDQAADQMACATMTWRVEHEVENAAIT
jgi:hypothetical protein